MGRVRAYIGLGANVGDAEGTLLAAIKGLGALPDARVTGVSGLYVTQPVGVEDQPDFRNAVARLEVPSSPDPATGALALLVALKHLERSFGRRKRPRWGPRELDLDLLLFGRERVEVERPPEGLSLDKGEARRLLTVPHPEAGERLFVLAPLAELAPGLVPPGWDHTVDWMRRRREAIEGPAAVRRVGAWTGDRWEPLSPAGDEAEAPPRRRRRSPSARPGTRGSRASRRRPR